ncbi:MAG: ABC transporter substrate-binding protein, partial [Thermomicrobiales bacterium]
RERRHRAQATRGSVAEAEAARPGPPDTFGRRYAWLLPLLGVLLLVAVAWQAYRAGPPPSPNDYVIAYAGPLSGDNADIGDEQFAAAQMAAADLNARGGINGHQVRVRAFDDADDPEQARRVAEEIVADESVLLVIGHQASATTLAAAPIYQQADLTVISPSSTADALSDGDPWVFRTIFTNSEEGAFAAAYARHALGAQTAGIVATDGAYETSLADAFAAEFSTDGDAVRRWTMDPNDLEASAARIVDDLRENPETGVLFLALNPDEAEPLVLAMGRAGLRPTTLGGDALGFNAFARRFVDQPEEISQPGFFTNGLYSVSPLLYDGLDGTSLGFAEQFRAAFGHRPSWFGARAYDAAALAFYGFEGLDGADVLDSSTADMRSRVQETLAGLDGAHGTVPGLAGALSFSPDRTVPQSLAIGMFDFGALKTAPVQFRPTSAMRDPDLAADEAAGEAFALDGQVFREYRVVYVGIDINQISNIDPRAQTFDADFFLWFRYAGAKDAEDIFFINANDPDLALPSPIDRTESENEHFVIYRVDSTFNAPMDFRNYPWDRHLLTIGLQNLTLSEDAIVYVPDQSNLRQTQEERLSSGVDVTVPFNQAPGWIASQVLFARDSATTRGTTPDARTGAPELREASTYEVELFYARDVRAFLVKNLLPLALLALVTYISLFFSPANAGTRIGFSITAILTTSVMLQSISSNLPDVGYTVAIEWGYYLYIGLSAVLVLVNITIERWYKAKRYAAVEQLDRIARVMYPMVILLVVAAYAVRFT